MNLSNIYFLNNFLEAIYMIIKEIMKQSNCHNINIDILNEDNYNFLINEIKFKYIKESYAGSYFWNSLIGYKNSHKI